MKGGDYQELQMRLPDGRVAFVPTPPTEEGFELILTFIRLWKKHLHSSSPVIDYEI